MDDGGTQECIEDRPAYCLSRCDNEKFPRNLHEVVSTFTNFPSKVYQGLGLGAKGLNVHFGSDRNSPLSIPADEGKMTFTSLFAHWHNYLPVAQMT